MSWDAPSIDIRHHVLPQTVVCHVLMGILGESLGNITNYISSLLGLALNFNTKLPPYCCTHGASHGQISNKQSRTHRQFSLFMFMPPCSLELRCEKWFPLQEIIHAHLLRQKSAANGGEFSRPEFTNILSFRRSPRVPIPSILLSTIRMGHHKIIQRWNYR